jgi:hypothetical protein
MRRSLAFTFAVIFVVGSTIPALARGRAPGRVPGTVARGSSVGPELPLGPGLPSQGDALQNRIPAPLPPPPQPPRINGPLNPSGLPPMGNGIR